MCVTLCLSSRSEAAAARPHRCFHAQLCNDYEEDRNRSKQLESSLTDEERETLNSSAGELGWLARQLRCDIAFENGCIQRCKADPCVADLVRLKSYIGMARRGADFQQRYWSDVNLRDGVLVHLADSGHANGTPERDEVLRYRLVGGCFILIADSCILEAKEARCNIIAFHSSLLKRVCRSTLAAEASHLAEAVQTGDWIAVLLEEAMTGNVDLKNWSEVVEARARVYVTDARSVFDYLTKDSTSTSSDKRMAIEGALLRETVKRPGASVRWIDGMQNIADVLTKANADKTLLRELLRTGKLCLVQTEQNKVLKKKKQQAEEGEAEEVEVAVPPQQQLLRLFARGGKKRMAAQKVWEVVDKSVLDRGDKGCSGLGLGRAVCPTAIPGQCRPHHPDSLPVQDRWQPKPKMQSPSQGGKRPQGE